MKKGAKKLIIANWKMNPSTQEKAIELFKKISSRAEKSSKVKLVIAPPFPFIPLFKKPRGIEFAAQDVFWEPQGAYTGEVSVKMLQSLGVSYVILGHSERREHLAETDEMVNKKVKSALSTGLKAVLCVGERSRQDPNFQEFVRNELFLDLKDVSARLAKNLIIAYEPIWAIGTGEAVGPDDLLEMTTYIRRVIFDVLGKKAAYETPILYGGSVDAKNAARFAYIKNIAGLLVGGASLNSKEFRQIVSSVNPVRKPSVRPNL